MSYIIKFFAKWVLPIGIVQWCARKNDNLFSVDSIGDGGELVNQKNIQVLVY